MLKTRAIINTNKLNTIPIPIINIIVIFLYSEPLVLIRMSEKFELKIVNINAMTNIFAKFM